MDENTFLQTIENSYKETDDGEFSTLSVLLTPMDLLKSDERFARAQLYQINSGETELSIIHDRFNENDNKALEVYYNKTFIGYVRKRFDSEYIDNTELVDEFCFDDNKFRDLQLLWNGIEFILKGMSIEKREKLKKEKESLLKNIYEYRDIMFGQGLKWVSIELQDDKELVMAYVYIIGDELEYASERLQNDKEVVLTALKTDIKYKVVKFASNELKNDPEIIWIASKKNSDGFKYAGKELLANKSFILTTLEKGLWWVFEYADEKLRADMEIATIAIEKTISNIEYCSDDLKNNTSFMLMAIEISGSALKYTDSSLKHDKDIVITAVNTYGLALEYASERLQDDKEVVLASVTNEGRALKYASQVLCDDKEVVLAAVKSNGETFEHVSQRLRSDIEVLLVAISNIDLKYSSYPIHEIFDKTNKDILKDKSFLLRTIKNNIPILDELHNYYGMDEWVEEIDDEDIILMAYNKYPDEYNQLHYASKRLLGDKEFALKVIHIDSSKKEEERDKNRRCLEFFSEELRNDRDVVAAALRKNGREIRYVGEELKNDKTVILEAISELADFNYLDYVMEYVSDDLKSDKEFILDAITKNPMVFPSISVELKNDKDVVILAVRGLGWLIDDASDELQNDSEVILAAATEDMFDAQI